MKSIKIILVLLLAYFQNHAQSNNESIRMDQFTIVKKNSAEKFGSLPCYEQIKSEAEITRIFGKYSSKTSKTNVVDDSRYIKYTFSDASFVDLHPGSLVRFKLKGKSYCLLTSKGELFYVGMKSDELKRIFPESYKTLRPSDAKNEAGIYRCNVFLSGNINGKFEIFDATIVFTIDSTKGIVTEIATWEPV